MLRADSQWGGRPRLAAGSPGYKAGPGCLLEALVISLSSYSAAMLLAQPFPVGYAHTPMASFPHSIPPIPSFAPHGEDENVLLGHTAPTPAPNL